MARKNNYATYKRVKPTVHQCNAHFLTKQHDVQVFVKNLTDRSSTRDDTMMGQIQLFFPKIIKILLDFFQSVFLYYMCNENECSGQKVKKVN